MHAAWLEDADAEPVSEAVTRILTEQGAVVGEHTRSHVAFEGLDLDREAAAGTGHTFERGGVVTLVQPGGEREVEVRVRVRAWLPSRVFWWTVSVETAIALLVFFLNPSPSGWFAIGMALWAVFVVVALLYLGTLPASRRAERDLLAAIVAAAPDLGARAATEEERLRARATEEIDAELLARKLKPGK